MKFKKISALLVSSLIFAGCTLPTSKPTQNSVSNGGSEETIEKQNGTIEKEKMVVPDVAQEKKEPMVVENTGEVQLNASNFTFKVDEIKAKVGEDLVIMVTNDSGTHDFVIDELKISTGIIPEGETVEVIIPTDKPGTYEYYCSIGKHRELGMKGTIVIE